MVPEPLERLLSSAEFVISERAEVLAVLNKPAKVSDAPNVSAQSGDKRGVRL